MSSSSKFSWFPLWRQYALSTVLRTGCSAMHTLGITSYTPRAEADRITLEMFSRDAYVTLLLPCCLHNSVTCLHNGHCLAHTFDIHLYRFNYQIIVLFAVSLVYYSNNWTVYFISVLQESWSVGSVGNSWSWLVSMCHRDFSFD